MSDVNEDRPGDRPTGGLRSWIVDVVVVVVCFVIGAVPGLIVGVAAQVAVRLSGPRLVAMGAFSMLVVAAVATAVEPRTADEVLFQFSKDHVVAAEAARLAGVLLVVAVVGFARAERSERRAEPTSGADESQ